MKTFYAKSEAISLPTHAVSVQSAKFWVEYGWRNIKRGYKIRRIASIKQSTINH